MARPEERASGQDAKRRQWGGGEGMEKVLSGECRGRHDYWTWQMVRGLGFMPPGGGKKGLWVNT